MPATNSQSRDVTAFARVSTDGVRRQLWLLALLGFAAVLAGRADAQDVRYSWFEIDYVSQDAELEGVQANPGLNQQVNIQTSDGSGVRFRGSIGTWHNLYVFVDYTSVDPDVAGVVTNDQGEFPAMDEFDLTTVRGAVGYRIPLGYGTDINAELSYDSLDFDFGSFAGEDFDTGDRGFGAAVALRKVFADRLELRAHVRYSSVGKADLTTLEVEEDTLAGVGLSYMFIRGLSLSLDYETGEIDSIGVGFRLDLDEN